MSEHLAKDNSSNGPNLLCKGDNKLFIDMIFLSAAKKLKKDKTTNSPRRSKSSKVKNGEIQNILSSFNIRRIARKNEIIIIGHKNKTFVQTFGCCPAPTFL